MKSGKIDARILKSKKAIQDAFKELIQTQNLSEITISELTAKAGVTRSTYYLYYQKVTDVRDDIENGIVEKIEKVISDVGFVKSMISPYPLLKMIADIILEEDANNKFIFVEKDSNYMLDRIANKIVDSYVLLTKKSSTEVDLDRVSYTANFVAAGICATFKKWYLDGCVIPLENVCEQLSSAIMKSYQVLSAQ